MQSKETLFVQAVRIIGITGRKGVGKDTAGMALKLRGWHQDSFADPIRKCVADLLGVSLSELEAIKEQPVEWLYKEPFAASMTPRKMMQTLGTEWGREMVHGELWLRALDRRIAGKTQVFISDVRFVNEATFIHKLGGHVIEIVRETGHQDSHASEAGLDPTFVDARVTNDGSIELLQLRLLDVIHQLSLGEINRKTYHAPSAEEYAPAFSSDLHD